MSKPKEYSWMTKDKLMIYTFGALLILTILAIIMWYPVTEPSGWNLGLTVGIVALIAVGVAVGLDTLISKVASDATMNTMSAAVFGLIVTLSYSLGAPIMSQNATATAFLSAPDAFLYVAIISTIGLVIFKKLLPRKYVNPAAAAKLLVLLPFLADTLLAKEHFEGLASGGLGVPILAGPIGGGLTPIGSNGLASFATYLQQCYSFPSITTTYPDTNQIMILEKFHGWVGGASSLAVIIVGIALFVLARRFIKWRITVAYFVSIAIMSVIMSAVYADADFMTRLVFEVFIGSSIFLGFFMATDPASTPLTYSGQAVFGVGLGVLTVLIQTYMNFFGGSILALVVMNLVSPLLDGLGKLRPTAEKKIPKLPKAEQFTAVKVYQCIRCGACMRVCCHQLSPILIKEAFDKIKVEKLAKLQADLCDGCGHCSFVCPSRIDLKGSILRAKVMLRAEQPPA